MPNHRLEQLKEQFSALSKAELGKK